LAASIQLSTGRPISARHPRETPMRMIKSFAITVVAVMLVVGSCRLPLPPGSTAAFAGEATVTQNVAVGPQYDTTHVYVAPEDFDRFVASLVATFGGTTSKQGVP
jgi:hypothetical protein